jgi:hypothetical protein
MHLVVDDNGIAELRKELADWKVRAETAQQELNEERKNRMLRDVIREDADIIDADGAAQTIAKDVVYEAGKLRGVHEALAALKAKKPYYTHSGNPRAKDLAGRNISAEVRAAKDLDLAKQIFGRGSSGALANKVKKSDSAEYARLRQIAIDNKIF